MYRFAFASGTIGLAGIPAVQYSTKSNAIFGRPVIRFSKEQLRATCIAYGQKWVEDPSNSKTVDHRGKVRQMLKLWEQHGITQEELYNVNEHITLIRNIMVTRLNHFVLNNVKFDHVLGFAAINRKAFFAADADLATRVFLLVCQYVTNKEFTSVRYGSAKILLQEFESKLDTFSFGGCLITLKNNNIYMSRELFRNRNDNIVTTEFGTGCVWDNRFEIALEQYNVWDTSVSDAERAIDLKEQEKHILRQVHNDRNLLFHNSRIPGYKGLVDTNPNAKLIIRRFTQLDWVDLIQKYKYLKHSVVVLPDFLRETLPLIEDEKGILAVPFLSFKRQRDIYFQIKFKHRVHNQYTSMEPWDQKFCGY